MEALQLTTMRHPPPTECCILSTLSRLIHAAFSPTLSASVMSDGTKSARGGVLLQIRPQRTTRVGALTNARLASEHHAVLQRLRRLQPVGVDVRVVHVQADEMTQPMWHEQAMQIEGKSAFGAASHEPSRHEVAQQEQRRVTVYFIIF